ncbi:MAG: cupin domain-containing protein [Planctomycetes bacterium]|nr:cupin domain-containing protein [Planctomycetota bacterium]
MLIKRIDEVPAVPVEMDGAKDVSVRVLFGPDDAAPTFAMRVFDLDKSGHTPYHSHPFEHEVIVLGGEIIAVTETAETPLTAGDVVMMMPDETHQFRNASNTDKARMVCLVPIQYQK